MNRAPSIVLVSILLLAGVTLAHNDQTFSAPDSVSDSTEELLGIEELDEVAVDEGPPSLRDRLGELHSAAVHFPIAWMLLLCLVELSALIRNRPEWHRFGFYLLAITLLSFVPAVVTGLIQAGKTNFTGEYADILKLHRNLNILSTTGTLVALLLRCRLNTESNRIHRLLYVALVIALTAAVLYSGHLGGRLVHG